MKSLNKILYILIFVAISSVINSEKVSAHQTSVSFQVFYDNLSPYGQWVDYPTYGYVWIPDAGPDFVPYSTDGHWVMTDYGWMWVSDYEWGWAPFHYGRWSLDNSLGWFWVPDTEWGPSWVVWRRAEGYYGWEPLEPGVSVSVVLGGSYHSPHDHWVFVRDRDIERPNIYRYHVDRNEHERIIRNSTIINKTYVDNSRHVTYIAGPSREDVQRATGRKINPVAVRENNRPGQVVDNNQVRIYRPQVVRNNNGGQRPAPTRVTDAKNVRRSSNATGQPQSATHADNGRRETSPNNKPQVSTPPSSRGRETRPSKVAPQDNTKDKTKPVQPQNRPENMGKEQQPHPENQRNRNNSVQPGQPQTPQHNEMNRRERPSENVKPPEHKPETQPQRTQPSVNPGNEHKQEVKPQNNNERSVEPQKRSNPGAQRQNATPSNNNKREQPQEKKNEPDKREHRD